MDEILHRLSHGEKRYKKGNILFHLDRRHPNRVGSIQDFPYWTFLVRQWQVELIETNMYKTAYTLGSGLWQFRVILVVSVTFDRLMENVLKWPGKYVGGDFCTYENINRGKQRGDQRPRSQLKQWFFYTTKCNREALQLLPGSAETGFIKRG